MPNRHSVRCGTRVRRMVSCFLPLYDFHPILCDNRDFPKVLPAPRWPSRKGSVGGTSAGCHPPEPLASRTPLIWLKCIFKRNKPASWAFCKRQCRLYDEMDFLHCTMAFPHRCCDSWHIQLHDSVSMRWRNSPWALRNHLLESPCLWRRWQAPQVV